MGTTVTAGYVGAAAAAKIAKRSRERLLRLLQEDKIESVVLEGRYAVSLASLHHFLAEEAKPKQAK